MHNTFECFSLKRGRIKLSKKRTQREFPQFPIMAIDRIHSVLRNLNTGVCILLFLLLQPRLLQALQFSGRINENTTFFYRKLPVTPSVRAKIEFTVSHQLGSEGYKYPLMGIYTEYPTINIEQRCSYVTYGQLRNENLHPYLREGQYRTTRCTSSGSDNVNCRGEVTIQDYIPRNFFLTFGFRCNVLHGSSLKDLTYTISFTEQSNKTNSCIKYSEKFHTNACNMFYHETSMPNLIGDESLDQISEYFDVYKAYETGAIFEGRCYQHIEEIACHVIFPKCNAATKEVIHPCREMCWDFKDACLAKWFLLIKKAVSKYGWPKHILNGFSRSTDCDYLPSLHGSVPCFYKPVTCDSPPDISNDAIILNSTQEKIYHIHDVVHYACINDGFQIRGNDSITCLYSGEWSQPSHRCTNQGNTSINPLSIVLPILIIPFLVLLIMFIKFKVMSKTIPVLSRAREFDALVCYRFDTDNDYVVNVILKNLEEMCDPPLKLCVHERDFLPGLEIQDNIKDGITKSNCAIIVMSQAFVDSDWCRKEFGFCYLENMKDPAFRIFMIMVQPAESLDNLPEHMQSFIDSRTYLSKYDPKLFQKIVCYLHWVKLPTEEKGRELPRLEDDDVLIKKKNNEVYLSDSEFEMEFVPADPFLTVGNNQEHDVDHTNDQNTEVQEYDFKRDMFQFEAEVHHSYL